LIHYGILKIHITAGLLAGLSAASKRSTQS
jgi:hypothetical protein